MPSTGDGISMQFFRKCHLCSKVKTGGDQWRVDYEMAFHYDRRHNGWTKAEAERDVSANAPSDHAHSCSSPTCAINGITPSGKWPEVAP